MDFFRKIIIISCLIIISALGGYSLWYKSRHFASFKDRLQSEEVIEGEEIALHYQKVAEVGPGYFAICAGAKDIKVMEDIKGIRPGDIISFRGIFKKEATVELIDYYISKHRPLKYAVSILATFLTFLWLFANFRINWKEFTLVERKSCRTS